MTADNALYALGTCARQMYWGEKVNSLSRISSPVHCIYKWMCGWIRNNVCNTNNSIVTWVVYRAFIHK